MAFSNIRSFWTSISGVGSRRKDEYNFLPQDSVVISDRTKRASKLGEGSFAKVYKGRYDGKPCAVKVFKEEVLKRELSTEPANEVEILSKVQHPNIVRMYGMWLDPHKERAMAIVMELCDESLYDFIRKYRGEKVSIEKKLHILQDIARGMVYLHSQNIIHGDLRSSNTLLCHAEDKTVAKLADFAMAKLLDTDSQNHFTTTFTAEEYLPPEVFAHKQHKDHKKKWARLTPKVDVFCFGELVLEMGCETYPTPSRKNQGREMLTELQRREKHLAKLKQSDKESLGLIIRKCLADTPEGRASFTEILLEVEGYLIQYGERPDLDKLQDKTAESEYLRAQVLQMEADAKEERKALEDELMLTKQELQQKEQRLQDLEKDKERSLQSVDNVGVVFQRYEAIQAENQRLTDRVKDLQSDFERLQQQHSASVTRSEKYCGDIDHFQNEAARLSTELQELKRAVESTMRLKDTAEQQKQAADSTCATLQTELDALKRKNEITEKELRDSRMMAQQLATQNEEMTATASQRTTEVKQLNDRIANLERQVKHTTALKEKAEIELEAAKSDGHKLTSAMKALERTTMVLEEEKATLEKEVRDLTFELQVGAEDLSKKEKKIVRLTGDLEKAQKVIAEGEALEPVLKQRIKELEREKQDIMDAKAQLQASLVSYEANKDLLQAAQLQRFQALAERDKCMGRISTLQQKLLEEEEENHLLRREVADAKKRYQYLKDEKESLVDQQSIHLDDLHSRFVALQSELESVKEENDIIKIHRHQYDSNLRQLASEHLHMKNKLVAAVRDSLDVMQEKMVHNIKEFTSLDTAQETVAEHVKEAESQYQAAESELRKLERETENYRRKLLDLPHPTEEQLYNHVVPAVAAKWREVATYLGLESHVITSVHVDQSSAEDSCLKVLLRWMDGAGKQPKTWVTVLEAMRRADFTETARELEVKIRSNSL